MAALLSRLKDKLCDIGKGKIMKVGKSNEDLAHIPPGDYFGGS
jgi:hypothetical protein